MEEREVGLAGPDEALFAGDKGHVSIYSRGLDEHELSHIVNVVIMPSHAHNVHEVKCWSVNG